MAELTRMQRLREAVLAVSPDQLRSAVRAIPEDAVRALPAQARPLASQLRRSPKPADLLRRMPHPAVVLVLSDAIGDGCLEAIRDALGDAADDPTRDQLVEALEVVAADFDVATIRVVLASVAVGEAEAADLCDALLTEDDSRFALPA